MKTSAHKPRTKRGSEPKAKSDLQSVSMPELQAKLESSPDGLTQVEAAKRLVQYGPNEIEEKKDNPFLKFLTYLWGPIPWMIEAAVVLSALAQHWPDFGIILVLLLANAVVGFWEEHQAGNAIAALKAKLAVEARVRRMANGSRRRRANWFRATSSACVWATSCPQTPACSMATRSRWISPR